MSTQEADKRSAGRGARGRPAREEPLNESLRRGYPDGLPFAMFAEQMRAWRRMTNATLALDELSRPPAPYSPSETVYESGMVRLLHYRRRRPAKYLEPVLLCYALVNRPYILDLMRGRSVVRQYLDRGFDVYMIDWGAPSEEDHQLTLKDYVCGFLRDMVQFVARESRCERPHLLGYCMGGTMSAMFTAQNPELVRSLTLLAAPIDFAGHRTLLDCWTDRRYFDVDTLIDSYKNCPGWFLQSCFSLMNPVHNFFGKYMDFYEHMDDPKAVANFAAMERWVFDNIPVAGEVFREFVKCFYQANQLVEGKFSLDGRRVDLGEIRCPLLLLTAKNDNLVAPASTEEIRRYVGTYDVRSMSIEGGHVGLVTGTKAQATLWPEATRWMADRSTAAESLPSGGV